MPMAPLKTRVLPKPEPLLFTLIVKFPLTVMPLVVKVVLLLLRRLLGRVHRN